MCSEFARLSELEFSARVEILDNEEEEGKESVRRTTRRDARVCVWSSWKSSSRNSRKCSLLWRKETNSTIESHNELEKEIIEFPYKGINAFNWS